MHAHPHGHPHAAQKYPPLLTKTNVIHFIYLAATTLAYFNVFSFQSFLGTFVIYIFWSLLCALTCATVITPQVLQRPATFLSRYMILSFIGFVVCSFFIDWKARALFSRDIFPQRIVHLDMKAAPPTVKYLESVFPLFASFGATGVLIEWDNMFPYEDTEKFKFSAARADDAYTKEEVNKIINLAKSNGLKVYPLIQTFGQMDFLLKHPEFAQYRALPNEFGTIHPTSSDSKDLVIALINQVLTLHPKTDMVHLGANQVKLMCSNCAMKDPEDIFLEYMKPIFEYVKEKKLKALIWDDMLREWPIEKLTELPPVCEVVTWRQGDVGNRNPGLENYFKVFKTLWAGSPYRGDGQSHFPLLKDYVAHAIVTSQIARASKLDKSIPPFSGVIVTGFSRSPDTQGTVSEILPASIPSLGFVLGALKSGVLTERTENTLLKELGLEGIHFGSKMDKLCNEALSASASFPGSSAFKMAAALELTKFKAPDSTPDIRTSIDGILKIRAANEIEEKISKLK